MLSIVSKPTYYSNLSRSSFNLSQHVYRDHQSNQLNLNQLNLNQLNLNQLNLNQLNLNQLNLNQLNLNQLNLNQRRSLSTDSFVQAAISINKTITNSIFTDYIQKSLISIHDSIGLPWYLEICLASIVIRAGTLGLIVSERKQSSVYERQFMPEINKRLERIQEISRRKLQLRELRSEKQARHWFNQEKKKIKQELYQKYNCHPGRKVITILSNFPIWLLMSFSIGNLCARNLAMIEKQSVMNNVMHVAPQVSFEGCLWFQNLSLPDQYHVLPVLLALSLFVSIEYNVLVRRYNYIDDTFLIKFLTRSIRVIAVILPLTACITPSGLALFWLSNSVSGLTYNILINKPAVKKVLRIQDTIGTKKSPGFKELLKHLKNKISIF